MSALPPSGKRAAPGGLSDPCRGCGQPIPKADLGTPDNFGSLWCHSEFGMTALRVHPTTECGKAALANTGYTMLKGNKPPESKRDRDARLEREREAAKLAERTARNA